MVLSDKLELREYQKKIAETASAANTLVVLPTGLGKTMIAIQVASNRLEKFPQGKVVVLAPTRPLVIQHYSTFKKHLRMPEGSLAVLTGTVDPGEREVLWIRSRVLFATPQTVYNDARMGRADLRKVVLVVFDEAHRCVKDYSYTRLAKAYTEESSNSLILGLTASPGGTKDKINEIKRNLYIERVEARTEDSEDVKGYVEQTAIEALKVPIPPEYSEVIARLRELFNDKVKKLKDGGFLRDSRVSKKSLLEARGTITARLNHAKASGGQTGYIFGAIINQAQSIAILHAIEVIETQGAPTLARYLDRLRNKPEMGKSAAALLKDPKWLKIEELATAITGVEHTKMTVLKTTVKEQMAKKADSKVIIFTQYRDTIEDIVRALGEVRLPAQRFVGQADRVGSDGMDQATQTDTLEQFRNGEFNILVSSSIGEEGLHVPDVDLVVFYEAVPSEIRFIQRRGRTGRTTEGRVVILLAEGTVDEAYYYSSLSKQSRMNQLVAHADDKAPSKRRTKSPTLLDYVE